MDGFRFKIGDIVRHKAADTMDASGFESRKDGDAIKKFRWGGSRGTRYIILGRIIEECHGGIQRHYRCRLVSAEGSVPYQAPLVIDFAEFEVEAHEPVKHEVIE